MQVFETTATAETRTAETYRGFWRTKEVFLSQSIPNWEGYHQVGLIDYDEWQAITSYTALSVSARIKEFEKVLCFKKHRRS